MKIIFKIAKTELKLLFYSPIAWFLLTIFLITCGLAYTQTLYDLAVYMDIMPPGTKSDDSITASIFTGMDGFFAIVMEKMYLFIPLLTMSIMSRETSSGTIRLLYSSPIRVRSIVFGKFLGIMIYSLLLILIIMIFICSASAHIHLADLPMLLSGALGIYLLVLAYASIGLFMSCLTAYQVVAAISTFVMIGILSLVGEVWQNIDFIRDLTYYLSMQGRANRLIGGLLTTKDVLYFIVIIYIFLGLSIIKLKAGMESKSKQIILMRAAGVIGSALLIGYLTSLPSFTGYADVTATKKNTLSPNSQKIVKELKGAPLEVTIYNNILHPMAQLGFPNQRNKELARWDKYIRFKNDISLKYVQYYNKNLESNSMYAEDQTEPLPSLAGKIIKAYRLDSASIKTPADINKIIDLNPESNRYVAHLKWKDKSTFLRIYNDMKTFPSESEVMAAFKRLVEKKLPKILFVTGNLERNIHRNSGRDYQVIANQKTFRYSLINQGFDSDTIQLDQQNIPSGTTTLVISDPKFNYSETALSKLKQYISSGGNVLINCEPGRNTIIQPVLDLLNLSLMQGQIVQQNPQTTPDNAFNIPEKVAGEMFPLLKTSIQDSVMTNLQGVTGIAYANNTGFKIEPLINSDSKTGWLKHNKLDPDMTVDADASSMNTAPTRRGRRPVGPPAKYTGTLTFQAAEGDLKGSFPLVVRLSRQINGRPQRIVVSGDADFMSTGVLTGSQVEVNNFLFTMGVFRWLSDDKFPIDANHKREEDRLLNVKLETVEMLKIGYHWILPAILIALAVVLLLRRKRK
ncbi:Gldg family protein [Pedobacter psychroterrae]|uniref:ABC transporter n=1 Tax=Pedobacter psychroterrae TaxID=2530453 RepID=A0A4R0NM32_9SPHI|nr:Gldg family protein [Pedobacter psychroterrae]TCD01249.1 ABC transporter [Pedobacter psychroterrae]